MMPDVFAFDWDGVIVDSLPIKDEGFRKAFLVYGTDIAARAKDFHIAHRGLFRRDKFFRIFREIIDIFPTEKQLAEVERKFIENTYHEAMKASFFHGSSEIFSSLQHKPVYVVSAAPEEEIRNAVLYKGVEYYFKGVLGGPQKKSFHLKTIMKWENCRPDKLLFIGDALNDYKAALEVECQFIGIVSAGKESPFPSEVHIEPDLMTLNASIMKHKWLIP